MLHKWLIHLKNFFFNFWLHCISVASRELSLVVASRGYSQVAVHVLLIVVASLAVEHRLQGMWAPITVAHRFSCSKAFGIFLGLEIDPMCPALQADS